MSLVKLRGQFQKYTRALFPVVAIGIVLSIYLLIERNAILPRAGDPLNGELTEAQEHSLALFQDLTKLFINWSVAVVGGIGFFLKASIEGKYTLSRKSLVAGELVILCAVTSIFFGHMALNALLNMLALDTFSIRDKAALSYGLLQYLFFLMALLFFFAYVHYSFWRSAESS